MPTITKICNKQRIQTISLCQYLYLLCQELFIFPCAIISPQQSLLKSTLCPKSHYSLWVTNTVSMQLKEAHATIIILRSLPTSPDFLVIACLQCFWYYVKTQYSKSILPIMCHFIMLIGASHTVVHGIILVCHFISPSLLNGWVGLLVKVSLNYYKTKIIIERETICHESRKGWRVTFPMIFLQIGVWGVQLQNDFNKLG